MCTAAVAPLLLSLRRACRATATVAFLAGLCLLTVVAADYASDDRALRALYDATNGDGWVRGHRGDHQGWMNASLDHCLWYSVVCSHDGNVTRCVPLPLTAAAVSTVAAD